MNLKRFSGLVLGTAATGVLVMAESSCSVVVNDFKTQCETTQDCIDLAKNQPLGADGKPSVVGLICSAQHVCVRGDIDSACRNNDECRDAHNGEPYVCRESDNTCQPVDSACSSNLECQDAHDGQPYLCRASDHTCQSLILPGETADDPNICEILADPDDIANENTIWIGASVFVAPASNQGLELVRQDFNKLANGLPPATAASKARRPLAFVYCEADPTLEEGAEHLVNTLELPAIITSLDTTSEITVLNKYSLAAENPVFQLSTSAGGALLKTVDNQGMLLDLVLINENYDIEATELVDKYYVPLLRAEGGPLAADEAPRVAILHSGTPTYTSLAGKMQTELSAVLPEDNLESFGYGNADEPAGTPAQHANVVSQILKFKPHVIIVMGDDEIGPAFDDAGEQTAAGIDVPIEKGWEAAAGEQPKPQWLSILGSVGQLPKDMGTLDSAEQIDWASRSLFIQQHYDFNGEAFTSYFTQLEDLVGDDPNGVLDVEKSSPYNEFLREGGYLTAYSIALLAAQGKPVTGVNLAAAARSFGKIDEDTPDYAIGKDNIFPALQSLAARKAPFNLENFQGWIGFDENGFAKYTFADDVACLTAGADPESGDPVVDTLQPTGGIFETSGTLTNEVKLSGCAGH
jgi:hypothetical protein